MACEYSMYEHGACVVLYAPARTRRDFIRTWKPLDFFLNDVHTRVTPIYPAGDCCHHIKHMSGIKMTSTTDARDHEMIFKNYTDG